MKKAFLTIVKRTGPPTFVLALTVFPYRGFFHGTWKQISDDRANFYGLIVEWTTTADWFEILDKKQILGVYEPVPVILKALLWRNLGALEVSTYHFISLVIHLLNVLILMLAVLPELLRRMAKPPRTSSVMLGTSLFGIHPLNVETVTWASCIPYLLAGLFSLLSFWCYLLSLQEKVDAWAVSPSKKPDVANILRSKKFSPLRKVWVVVKKDWRSITDRGSACMALSIIFYGMSLWSKAPGITLICVIIFFDVFIHHNPPHWSSLTSPFAFILLVLSSILKHIGFVMVCFFGFYRAFIAAEESASTQDPWQVYPLSYEERYLRPFYALWFYVEKLFVPARLHFWYYMKKDVLALNDVTIAARVTAFELISLILVFYPSKRKTNFFWWSWVFLLLPTTGLVTHGTDPLVAPRYFYIPFIFVFTPLLTMVIDDIFGDVTRSIVTKMFTFLIIVGYIICFLQTSEAFIEVYRDPVPL